MKPKTIALVVAVALFMFILLQNMRTEQIKVLIWPIEMPLLFYFLAFLVLGWVLGWFMHAMYARGKRRGSAQTQKETTPPQSGPGI